MYDFYITAILVIAELCANALAFRYLFPIKNADSCGYISRKNFSTVIPLLNKYDERFKAQLALPYELPVHKINNPTLTPYKNSETNLYGYKNESGKTVINEQYIEVYDFDGDYAIAAVDINGKKIYGTINKKAFGQ